jgi:hypothetical protein
MPSSFRERPAAGETAWLRGLRRDRGGELGLGALVAVRIRLLRLRQQEILEEERSEFRATR